MGAGREGRWGSRRVEGGARAGHEQGVPGRSNLQRGAVPAHRGVQLAALHEALPHLRGAVKGGGGKQVGAGCGWPAGGPRATWAPAGACRPRQAIGPEAQQRASLVSPCRLASMNSSLLRTTLPLRCLLPAAGGLPCGSARPPAAAAAAATPAGGLAAAGRPSSAASPPCRLLLLGDGLAALGLLLPGPRAAAPGCCSPWAWAASLRPPAAWPACWEAASCWGCGLGEGSAAPAPWGGTGSMEHAQCDLPAAHRRRKLRTKREGVACGGQEPPMRRKKGKKIGANRRVLSLQSLLARCSVQASSRHEQREGASAGPWGALAGQPGPGLAPAQRSSRRGAAWARPPWRHGAPLASAAAVLPPGVAGTGGFASSCPAHCARAWHRDGWMAAEQGGQQAPRRSGSRACSRSGPRPAACPSGADAPSKRAGRDTK